MAQEPDLPQLFSDDEFDQAQKERDKLGRAENDRWDNAGVRPAHKPTDGLPECTIEQRFPRIAQKLTMIWPSEACASYIKDLIVNIDRDTRQGFPVEVIEDFLMLAEINEMLLRKAIPGAPVPPKSSGPIRPSR
jgi:hypothetical protein